ncbi:hypothetical protein ACWCYY_11635 [Kitasatospora sp. NPDC001664]
MESEPPVAGRHHDDVFEDGTTALGLAFGAGLSTMVLAVAVILRAGTRFENLLGALLVSAGAAVAVMTGVFVISIFRFRRHGIGGGYVAGTVTITLLGFLGAWWVAVR